MLLNTITRVSSKWRTIAVFLLKERFALLGFGGVVPDEEILNPSLHHWCDPGDANEWLDETDPFLDGCIGDWVEAEDMTTDLREDIDEACWDSFIVGGGEDELDEEAEDDFDDFVDQAGEESMNATRVRLISKQLDFDSVASSSSDALQPHEDADNISFHTAAAAEPHSAVK